MKHVRPKTPTEKAKITRQLNKHRIIGMDGIDILYSQYLSIYSHKMGNTKGCISKKDFISKICNLDIIRIGNVLFMHNAITTWSVAV